MAQENLDKRLIGEFMGGWQRLFKIGVYYPTGHEILDKATTRFRQALLAIAGDERAVTIEYSGELLKLADIEISDKLPFVREFKDQLSTLSISAITFDRQATDEEILLLVRQLLAGLAATRNSRQFTRIDLATLPSSVQVRQQEFISQGSSDGGGFSGMGRQYLEVLYQSLAERGLSFEQISQCQRLLESLPQQMQRSDAEHLPSASWDDIARLLALYAKKETTGPDSVPQPFVSNSSINALATIFQELAIGPAAEKARQAINLLVDASRRTTAEQEVDSTDEVSNLHRRNTTEEPTVEIDQLQDFVNSNSFKSVILEKIPAATTDPETLSMLLHFATFPQTENSWLRIELLLRRLLADGLTKRYQSLLEQGLTMLIASANEETINKLLPMVLAPLRRAAPATTLPLLLSLARRSDRNGLYALWPHAVNELLMVGNLKETDDYLQMATLASEMPIDAMASLWPKLQTLSAFAEGAVADTIGQGLTRGTFLVFAFLLKTEYKQLITEKLLAGFKEQPPDALLAAIAPVLLADRPDHQLFLQTYLQQAGQKKLSRAITLVAGRMIVTQLAELPRERRGESWVCDTVVALGEIASDEVQGFLQLVVSQKKILLIPEWPIEVREAATLALSKQRKRR